MKVLMVEPEKKPYVKELAGDLQSMQKAVEGLIECVYPYMDPVGIVCNEEGKMLGLPLNRAIYSDTGEMVDIIAGNFFVTGLEGEEFADLTDALLDKYMKMFQSPELFINLNGKIMAIPVPTEELQNIAFGKVATQDVSAEAQANHPRRIFVDMDGTLAKFNPIAKIEDLYEQGYFAALEPQQNVVDAVKLLCEDSRFEVYILSSVLDSEYALQEKNQWLDAHLPQVDTEHRLFPSYGETKQSVIPNGLQPTDTLFDDYSLNLHAWCPPGQAIKCMNGINGTNGTWQGARVFHTDAPEQIAEEIADYALQQQTLQETAAQEAETQLAEVMLE